MYNKPLACVTNNGHSTEFFEISRGIRQGCPISALLFILVVEVMAINLKKHTGIKGIKVNTKEMLLTQLADDTTLFIRDKDSLKHAILNLDHFYRCAGLRLNKDKTEAFLLGQNNNICLKQFGIKIIENQFKSLGIVLSKNPKAIVQYNFDNKILKVRNLLNMWKSRQLSIKGKITLLQSQALPLILYPASIL